MRPFSTIAFRALITAATGLTIMAQAALGKDKVPPEFQGDWVPMKAPCESPARFRMSETTMTLINGKDTASYDDIGITHTYFGPDYQGISFVGMPEFNSGNAPFTVYFNPDEQKDAVKLAIYEEIKGNLNPQLKAIQDAAKKLAARFPLNLMPLKKCPSK